MVAVNENLASWEALHAGFEKDSGANGDAWVRPLREEAFERFLALGFPDTTLEDWRFTNVAPIARTAFRRVGTPRVDGLRSGVGGCLSCEKGKCCLLVFLNGHFAPHLSRVAALPGGAVVQDLRSALRDHRDLVEPRLGRIVDRKDHAFALLNTAFLRDGAFVHVPRRSGIEGPIHLLFLSAPAGEGPAVAHPRILVHAEDGASATIYESYVGSGGEGYFTNAVTEIALGDDAAIDHYKFEREEETAHHVAVTHVVQGRDSRYVSHSIALGGGLVRNDLSVTLAGAGADCTLNGLYVLGGRQHVDNHTLIDHATPNGTSRELYKGVLDGESRGVFHGRIIVRPDAQKTDARQTNKNLLLSNGALVDTNPQLEIRADDVKCAHGATIGQIEEEALFYLRSRAIDDVLARHILTHAFVSDVVGRIKVGEIRAELGELVATKVQQGLARREM